MQGLAIIFLLLTVASCFIAWTGIAVAISFYAKIFLLIAFISFLVFLLLLFLSNPKQKT